MLPLPFSIAPPPPSTSLGACPPSLLFCFSFFLVDHHYALSVFSVSADLLPPSSFPLPTVLSVWWGKWEERKRLHPDVKDAKCLGHSHTASPPLCVRMCDWQCNSGELEWGVEVVLLNFQMHTVLCESSVDHSFWDTQKLTKKQEIIWIQDLAVLHYCI